MKRIIFGVLLVILSLVLVSCGSSEFPPEPPAPGETGDTQGAVAGQAYNPALGELGYADPTGSFLINRDNLELVGAAATADLYLQVSGESYVYSIGYRTNKLGEWEQFTFPGVGVSGSNWLEASAAATLSLDSTNSVEGENYVVAYACTRVGGTWDCHGSKWMIHAFVVDFVTCGSDADCAGGEICESTVCQTGCRKDTDCVGNPAGKYCDALVCGNTLPLAPTGPGVTATTTKTTSDSGSGTMSGDIVITSGTLAVAAGPDSADDDADGVNDDLDNCPLISNSIQLDQDSDGKGNVCDDDADADGYKKVTVGGNDCNDLDAAINPGAAEICDNGVDNDCDGKIGTEDSDCGAIVVSAKTVVSGTTLPGEITAAEAIVCGFSGWVAGRSYTLLKDQVTTGPCFQSVASGVTIDCAGRKITGLPNALGVSPYHGIYVVNKNNVNIKNCQISGFKFGLRMYNATDVVVSGNTVCGNEKDIYCSTSNPIGTGNFLNTKVACTNGWPATADYSACSAATVPTAK